MDAVLSSLHIHMLTIAPGSSAEGKTIGDLDLKTRYGIADCGLRRNNSTDIIANATTRLQAGDALIVFCSDRTAREISGRFCHSPD
jgi:CPA2 family monovalent cation:H+ antiporter-2